MRPSSVDEFEVVDREGIVYAVNLEERTCSCRRWQAHNFICPHAIAACRVRNRQVENYISEFYSTEYLRATYAGVHHPHGDISSWNIPPEVENIKVLPPQHKARAAGRPKKRRIPSQGEDIIRRKCTRCGQIGHNRQTCNSATPLSTQ
ncbi:MAG: hypothetical protein EOP45_10500 [Sphingobacteriaceae bacterium]|nr:MAG: hypothetical protein EOP45_10500 [Sphingobacteriaceae bacterium]